MFFNVMENARIAISSHPRTADRILEEPTRPPSFASSILPRFSQSAPSLPSLIYRCLPPETHASRIITKLLTIPVRRGAGRPALSIRSVSIARGEESRMAESDRGPSFGTEKCASEEAKEEEAKEEQEEEEEEEEERLSAE